MTAIREVYSMIPEVNEFERYIYVDVFQYAHVSLDHKDSVHFSVAWLPNNPNAYPEYKLLLEMLEKLYLQLQNVFKISAPVHEAGKKLVVYVGDMGGQVKADTNAILVETDCGAAVILARYAMSALRHKTSHTIGLNITRDRYVYDTLVGYILAHTFPDRKGPDFSGIMENCRFAVDSSHNTQYSKSYNKHRIGYLPEDGFHLLHHIAKLYGHNAISCVIHELKGNSDNLLVESLVKVLNKDIPCMLCDYVCDALKCTPISRYTPINKKDGVFSPTQRVECLGFQAVDLTAITPTVGNMYTLSWTCTPQQDLWRVIVFSPNPTIGVNGYDSMHLKSAFNQFIVFLPCFRSTTNPVYTFTIT